MKEQRSASRLFNLLKREILMTTYNIRKAISEGYVTEIGGDSNKALNDLDDYLLPKKKKILMYQVMKF